MIAQYVDNLFFFLVLIKLLEGVVWSTVPRPFLKPFCSSTKMSLAAVQLLRSLFKTEQYILYRALASVMPRYERGFRGSAVLDLGIYIFPPV